MVQGRKQKRGDLVSIPIGDGKHLYAVALTDPLFAFLGGVFEHGQLLASARDQSVLFKLPVFHTAVKSGRWTVVGKVDPTILCELDRVVFFKQDKISGDLSAYNPFTNAERPISFEEAERLECAAVWAPEQVEDRLRDYLLGVPNKWWASLRPRR
ncbi:hypothetical protein [Rhizobium sp.]|jgi:hypothetical protein|uniref:hypothetical protein n=1 Tax=Rhizobium sp. TaxID=391 RepID=UPI00289C7CD9